MRTAISVPDKVFVEAEQYARLARKTRSLLYSEAVAEYLERHSPNAVTEALEQVCDEVQEPVDQFVVEASRRTLERTKW